MAYTSVYNWNGYKANSLHWEFAHDARHIEDPQGKRKRSNENIDKARSAANRVLVNDGQGGFRPATSMDELHEAFHRRLGQRKGVKNRDGEIAQRKIRSDTNVATQFVVHLDPKFTGPASEVLDDPAKRAEIEDYHQVMIGEVVKRMGYDNVIYIAHHWDEQTPHVHIMCTSMTPDNRVQYRHALGRNGQSVDWRSFHDEMRQALIDAGFETDFERVSKGQKHFEPQIYKQVMDEMNLEAAYELEQARIDADFIRQDAERDAQKTRDDADSWAREREKEGREVFAQAVKDKETFVQSAREEWEEVELPKLRAKHEEAAKESAAPILEDARVKQQKADQALQDAKLREIAVGCREDAVSEDEEEMRQREAAQAQNEQLVRFRLQELKKLFEKFDNVLSQEALAARRREAKNELDRIFGRGNASQGGEVDGPEIV